MGALRLKGAAILVAATLVAACGGNGVEPLRIGSTTSLYDTGLLDSLLARWTAEHPGWSPQVIAVGSGEALALGRRGDVDLVLVHAPEAERAFVEAGHGFGRATFLRNDFVVAGPPEDPAGIRGLGSAEALRRIASTGTRFVSRGDDSGTHTREREIWEAAGRRPAGEWYEEVGQGMAAALLIASERDAYVLTDRATLRTTGAAGRLVPLVTDDPLLDNLYSVIQVSDAAAPVGACLLRAWLQGREAREIVTGFRPGGMDEPLFKPLPAEVEPPAESECRSGGASAVSALPGPGPVFRESAAAG